MYGLEGSKNYFVIPECLQKFGITNVGKYPDDYDMLIAIKQHEDLPVSKSCIVSRFHKKFFLTRQNTALQSSLEINKEGHRIKLTLSVDINNYPTICHEPVMLHKVKNMPKTLKVEKTKKVPIIGFFDNSSVICIWNDEESCNIFMDSWNGIYGKDLFMDFGFPKPTFAASSKEVTSLSGAAYDLIKIMSMSPDDIIINPDWKFKIISNEETPVLLEFNAFENSKKTETPVSVMAMLIKEHINAIWKETKQIPAKLGFRLLDEFINCASKERVKVGLEEVCEMIKIECFFV